MGPEITGELGLTVRTASPYRFEHVGFSAVFANEDFSDEFVIRTISRLMGRRAIAGPTEQDRFEATIHEDNYLSRQE